MGGDDDAAHPGDNEAFQLNGIVSDNNRGHSHAFRQ